MCIAGSRRGSGESCYQELSHGSKKLKDHQVVEQSLDIRDCDQFTLLHSCRIRNDEQKRTSESMVGDAELNSEEATLAAAGTTPSVPTFLTQGFGDATWATRRRISEVDRKLLDSLDIGENRHRHTGRFLTMHKRRRKRLTTRSLNRDPGMLDDIFHGQVECVLQKAGHWKFNAFTLETVTGGRSLPVLCVHLFHWYGLFQHFNLEVVRVWKLFSLIEEGYHSTNPYHNSIHATDVTQAMHCFLQEKKIRLHLSNLEIMASLIAAVTHDLDHPGVNQPFLVATSNHLAALYENTSVLENHHWRSAIGCLIESGVSEQLPDQVKPELQRHISSLILATDITRQQEFLTRFKDYLDTKTLDMRQAEHRHFILQIALKCADISNPCRPWEISRKWSYKVCEEFFRQGDYERQLNLPVTPLCDRHSTSIPKIQVGFFKFVVMPLYEEWHRFLEDPFSNGLMQHLRANQEQWEAMIAKETAEETKTEVSELEDESPIVVSTEEEPIYESGSDVHQPPQRRPSLPVKPTYPTGYGRRHSVPLSVMKTLHVAPRPTGRRESLPSEPCKLPTPVVKLEDSILGTSSMSLLSSRSSVPESSANAASTERPVSAENLLPEPSIASITNPAEASRLNSVLQPDNQKLCVQSQKYLTRQQTFPPVQPVTRMRYMSTTAEMSQCCSEALIEVDSTSNTSLNVSNETDLSPVDPSLIKRRASALPEMSKRNELTPGSAYPRRHSLQVVQDDGFRYRNRRPSSAQESDQTNMFYASLAGSVTVEVSEVTDMSELDSVSGLDRRISGEVSISEDLRTYSTSSRSERYAAQLDARLKKVDPEPRRHSTPVPDRRPVQEPGGRRFTAIPVTTETSTHNKVFFIGSPPESPPRDKSVTSSSDSGSGGEPRRSIGGSSCDSVSVGSKRDCDSSRDKSSKIPKLSYDLQMKENVDPRCAEDSSKGAPHSRRSSQGLSKRRGSAPVGLLARLEDIPAMPVPTRTDHYSRRGSVPADIASHQRDRENYPFNNNNNNNNNNNISSSNNNGSARFVEGPAPGCGMPSPRRGSVPADISELRRDLFSRNSVNGKSRGRKKVLRRRSSGGPEMFASVDGNDNNGWHRSKRDSTKRDSIPEPQVKRRGSLPIEMVAVSFAGSAAGARRSSLWRL